MSRHRNLLNMEDYDEDEYYDDEEDYDDDDYHNGNNHHYQPKNNNNILNNAVTNALAKQTTQSKDQQHQEGEWEEDWEDEDASHYYQDDDDYDYTAVPVTKKAPTSTSKAKTFTTPSAKATVPVSNVNASIKAPKPTKAQPTKRSSMTSLTLTPPKAAPYSISPSPPPHSPLAAVPSAKHIREKAALLEKETKCASMKPNLNLVIIGHVDQGKSTLVGHLLVLVGRVSEKLLNKYERESKEAGKGTFHFAWILDQTESERQRGVTSDIAYQHFESETRRFTLLDAPGHRDFIPNMISGASLADVAILVVSAVRGEFEAGFSGEGQTREHAILAKAMGAQQLIIAVNKCEMMDWDQGRYEEIITQLTPFLKSIGYKDKNIFSLPLSGLVGENIVTQSTSALQSWYTGPTLVELLETLHIPARANEKPTRISITDVYRTIAHGFCVNGKIETGHVVKDDTLLVQPSNEFVSVKSISSHGTAIDIGMAGDSVELSIREPSEQAIITVGQWLSDPQYPIPIVMQFCAQIITTNIRIPLLHGSSLIFYKQNYDQPVVLHKIRSILDQSTGAITKTNPRALYKNSTAEVEIISKKGICLELFSDNRALGRFTLRRGHETVAVGIVSSLIREQSSSSNIT